MQKVSNYTNYYLNPSLMINNAIIIINTCNNNIVTQIFSRRPPRLNLPRLEHNVFTVRQWLHEERSLTGQHHRVHLLLADSDHDEGILVAFQTSPS